MSMSQNAGLGVYVHSLPGAFNVEFRGEGMPHKAKHVTIPGGAFGMECISRDGALQDDVRQNPPPVDLDYENWTNLVNEDGTLRGVLFLSE
jgi:hypothetical protein